MKLVSIHKPIILFALVLIFANGSFAQTWSLERCIDSAQVNNKNLQIAKTQIELSTKKQEEARGNLLPKLNANLDYKYFTNLPYQLLPLSTFNPTAPEGQFNEAQFGVPHNINVNLQLAIPLYNPQIYGGIEATKIATEIAELQLQKNEEQVYFEIANLYYNAQILQNQIAFLDKNLGNANSLLSNLKLLKEQLLATGTDVGKVELQIAQLSTQKNAVDSKIQQVLNALKFTIGIAKGQAFEIDQNIAAINEINYDTKISLDTRLVLTQNKFINNDLNVIMKSRKWPIVNLIGSFGTTGYGYDKKPNAFLKFYPLGFVGLQVSYSIFNGNINLRKIDQKKIELKSNQLRTDMLQDQNEMQLSNAFQQRNTAFQAIRTTDLQIQLAQDIYNKTVLQQKQGVASLTEILLADNALREAQQSNLSGIIDYLKADLELKKITGNISN